MTERKTFGEGLLQSKIIHSWIINSVDRDKIFIVEINTIVIQMLVISLLFVTSSALVPTKRGIYLIRILNCENHQLFQDDNDSNEQAVVFSRPAAVLGMTHISISVTR